VKKPVAPEKITPVFVQHKKASPAVRKPGVVKKSPKVSAPAAKSKVVNSKLKAIKDAGRSKAAKPAAKLAAVTTAAAPPPHPPEPVPDVLGKIVVKWNHYEEECDIVNGSLQMGIIDEKMCLSFAYPNSKIHLSSEEVKGEGDVIVEAAQQVCEDPPGTYQGLQDGKVYWVRIEEDEEEKAKYDAAPKRVYVPPSAEDLELMGNGEKRGVDAITQELKKLSADELRQGSQRYKELIEARDLQDCLYNS